MNSPQLSTRILASSTGVLLIALVAWAHDDDPKILDLQGPVVSAGYRPAAFLAGGSLAPQSALHPSQTGQQALLNTLDDNHISFPSSGIHLLSWLPIAELEPSAWSANDCWGYVSPSGREYALIGLSSGTAFVDISTPSDPVVVHHEPGEISLWRDVKIYQHYAYIVSEGGGGIQICDLGQIDNGVVTLVNTIFSGGILSTHNVAIDTDSGFLYRCGGASGQGLRIYGLSNPTSPNLVGSWNGRYVHDVQVVTYTSGPFAGDQIAFACGGFGNGSGNTGLTILDVTQKNNIFSRAQVFYPNAAYSHQAWMSPDRTKLYLNDELDESGGLPTTTQVIDIANVDSPQVLGSFTNNNASIGHNLYTHGTQVFEANYRSGLRVFDTGAGASATEVAYFDTWPGDDEPHFNGLWSCYPDLPSGIVIGSDLERGLFMWWMGAPKLDISLVSAAPSVMNPAGGSIDFQIAELSAGDLQPGSEKLYYDIGAGLMELPLASLGAGTWQAQVPALPCGETLRWFVGARSTDGILWTLPESAPYDHFETAIAEAEIVVFEDDFETDRGWTIGTPNDSATSGIWVRADPLESAISPEDDHSVNGSLCFVTGVLGDIDGGATTLTSPLIDLSSAGNPQVSFWLYFQRGEMAQGVDRVVVEVSNDAGANWTLMENIKDVGNENEATWVHHTYRTAAWLAPTANTQIRLRAQDENLDTDINALLDDFRVTQAQCGCQISNYCTSAPNSNGTAATISSSGSASVSLNNFTLEVAGAMPAALGLFFYGAAQSQLPLAEGTLCVTGGAAGIQRLQLPILLDGTGSGSRFLDLAAAPAASGPGAILPGSTWNFQFWYRDPSGGPSGSNLSDGLEVKFCQ